jgi:hypothetical protein
LPPAHAFSVRILFSPRLAAPILTAGDEKSEGETAGDGIQTATRRPVGIFSIPVLCEDDLTSVAFARNFRRLRCNATSP